jgi:hypothetical protein
MEEKYKFLSSQTILRTLAFLVLLNLLFLDILIFRSPKTEIIEKTVSMPIVSNICSISCLEAIKEATRSVKLTVKSEPTPTTILPTATLTQAPASSSLVKEFFVPFGSGFNSSDDWQDVGGLKATLDLANYGSIKTVTFEATIRIPTGNETAYVRLFNATDKHPVWLSEVSLEGGTPQLLISKPITLDSGNKTYQVQMKTSLKFQAFLDQSRLHIITN